MKKLGSLLAIAALVASLVVSVVAPSPAGAGECDSPAVRDITINQGVGSYDRLAQGKEALVRVFLSLPSCAARGASITLDPASTTMTVTDGTSPLSPALTPVSPVGSAPALVAYSSGPAVDAAGDPKFVVPGAALSRADGAGLAAAFSFVIGYQYKASKSSTPVPGSITVTTLPGTTTPISKPVEKRVAPLRVLVVAMGDAARDYSTQLTPDGITAVQRGMHALGRMLPVADGVGSLADSGSPGIRYTITPTIIDLRPLGLLDAEGKFCGRQENFDPIKQSLATYLSEWNAASGNPRADRVLGVVDAAISYGGESMCADGWATIKGSVGWARAIPDTSTTPSMTGALMAMELGHTFGLVPPTRDRIGDLYHSPNEQADGTAPERAYNLTSRSYLAADKTALRMAANGWDGTTTVFEPADWAFAQCALGGTTSTECTQFASTDATAGAATGQRVFVLAGSIGHTATGHVANVVDSHEATAWPTGTTTDNHIVLVQLSGTKKVERTDNVHVAPEESAHHDHEAGDVVEDPTGTFRVAVPFDPDTTRIELRSGSQVLYTRTASPAPVMTAGASSTRVVGNQNISNDPAVDDTAAALSPDAELVAWQRPDGIVIASGDDPTQRVTITGASQPAISPRHDPSTRRYSVAYVVADGSIDMVEVDLASGTPVVGASRDVYLARPLLSPGIPASHPSFSPDNSRIAFEIQKDIATIELVRSPLPCAVLGALLCRPTKVAATAADETWPSWSQSDASTIAYVQGADVVVRSIGSGNDPADAAQAVVLATNATEPSFGTGVVAYRSTDATKPGLVLRDATAPGAAPVPITTDAS
ncbi:MAG: TolB family protein, partial [Actinomycetota bacterium]